MPGSERFNPDGLALSADYARTMDEIVLPVIAACRTDAVVRGDGGRPLFTSRFDAVEPRGTVLIVHGFTENVDKYAEILHSLLRSGFSVAAWDQRGHGRSWRAEGIDDVSLTHVDRFEEYVRDMEIICEKLLSGMPKPWAVFAHSMGGAVASLFLERHGGVFDRAALCAPMIAANRGGLPFFAGKLICRAAELSGRGKRRIFMSRPYAGPEDFETSCATGRERFDWYESLRARTPVFQNNGPSYGWTLQSLRASQLLLMPGAVERIDAAVRLYAAENDTAVLPSAQRMFARRLKNGRQTLVKGAKHEIYRSTDAVLFPWWREILEFYRAQ